MRHANQATIALIKKFESLHDGDLSAIGLQPKMCPAGVWTVGYGHALVDGNGRFLRGDADRDEAFRQYAYLEEAGACALLAQDLEPRCMSLSLSLRQPANDNQFGAMLSLAYNIGVKGFQTSSVLMYFNSGLLDKAAASFKLWNKGTVKGRRVVLPGLVKRREAEMKLFLTPI